jgi:hypothetical protein
MAKKKQQGLVTIKRMKWPDSGTYVVGSILSGII